MESGQNQNLICRMYREGDEYGIVKLFNRVFERQMTIEEWQWKYKGQGNPRVFSAVFEDSTAGIVGHYGGVPLKMLLDGEEIKGVTPVDTMIDPKFRSFVRLKNLFYFWERELVNDSIKVMYGFSPERVIKLAIERIKIYERVGPVFEARKGVTIHNNPVRYLYKLSPLAFDDRRIDDFWAEVKDQFRLAIIRDSAFFAWRYGKCPLFSYEMWGLTPRWSSALVGIAVIKKENTENLTVMDVLARRDRLVDLFSKLENLAITTGRKTISVWLPHHYDDLLKNKGFSLVDSGATIPASTHPLTLKRDEIWEKLFYTMGDTDFL